MNEFDSLKKEVNQIMGYNAWQMGNPQEEIGISPIEHPQLLLTEPVGVSPKTSAEAKKMAEQEMTLTEDIAKKTEEVSELETTVVSIQKELAELKAFAEKVVPPKVPVPSITPSVIAKVTMEPIEFAKKNWVWFLLGGTGITAVITVGLVAKKKK